MAEKDNPLANLAQKAFYFGMGLAALVADNVPKVAGNARDRLLELRRQLQALVDELVELGAMRAEEARAYMDAIAATVNRREEGKAAGGPRRITIEDMGEAEAEGSTAIELSEAARLRQQIAELQAELERIKKEAGKA
jgi:polyhydroxyalkanoate synthesis regulator phasin